MKNTKSIVVVLFALLTTQIASAYYCPSTGRWLTRDPIGEPGFETIQAANVVPQVGVASPSSLPPSRWIQRDPIGEGGGMNLYGVVGNDSVNGADYLGLEVIFVHGTWSSGPEAFPPDFVSHVQAYFHDGKRFFLEWSGDNTDAARAAAGTKLAEVIASIKKVNCKKPIRIVAHSHGGNVSLIASHMPDVTIDEMVTLGTPILQRYTRGPGIVHWDNVYSIDDWVQTKPIGAVRTSSQADRNIRLTGFGHSELHTVRAWDAAFPNSN